MTDEQIHEIAASYMEADGGVYVSFLPSNLDKFARALLSASKPAAPEGWKDAVCSHVAKMVIPRSREQWDTLKSLLDNAPAAPAQSAGISDAFKDWFEREWASYQDKAISGGKVVSMAWALKGYRAAAPAQSGEPATSPAPSEVSRDQ